MLHTLSDIKTRPKLLIKWALATSIGLTLGEVFLTEPVWRSVPYGMMLIVVNGLIIGFSVGILQSLILRTYMPSSWWWIISTSLGMAVAEVSKNLFITWAAPELQKYRADAFWPVMAGVAFFIYGGVIGLIQWVVLSKFFVRSWTWVLTNGFGWTLTMAITREFILPYIPPPRSAVFYDTMPFWLIAHGAIGILIGIITGVLMLWLFKVNRIRFQE